MGSPDGVIQDTDAEVCPDLEVDNEVDLTNNSLAMSECGKR